MVEGLYPQNLQEALILKKGHSEARIYAGGTDFMVNKGNLISVLFLNYVQEIKTIEEDSENIYLGAGCSYTEILSSEVAPDILKSAIKEIASPSIRNIGTIGGNICNASPAGDTLPVLYVLSAKVRIAYVNENNVKCQREVPIEEFILGVRKISLEKNVIVESVIIPKKNYLNMNCSYYKKVGGRNARAISKLSFVGLKRVENGEIADLRIAFGSIGPTIVRVEDIEKKWIGESYEELLENKENVKKEYEPYINPIDDQRSTAIYRKKVCLNLLIDFIAAE